MPWKQDRSKPLIGIIGGIGSGKSAVAAMFAEEGCAVIDSDQLSHAILQSEEVKKELRGWLGKGVFDVKNEVIRAAVGRIVFSDPKQLARLNQLIHPREEAERKALMEKALRDSAFKAIVWDTPLLVEVGLHRDCDAVVFVRVSPEIRQERVKGRGWSTEELLRREKMQIPLDKKAEVADYCIDNNGDQAASRRQVHEVLSHLLSKPQGESPKITGHPR
ncbi:MAG TPA: dephospho-CoA kinase [Phycisphaerae bacterium]|nr:dephospho-CoA kinase [Phycisphaerae bacterium]